MILGVNFSFQTAIGSSCHDQISWNCMCLNFLSFLPVECGNLRWAHSVNQKTKFVCHHNLLINRPTVLEAKGSPRVDHILSELGIQRGGCYGDRHVLNLF
jgi:hypothetical protein